MNIQTELFDAWVFLEWASSRTRGYWEIIELCWGRCRFSGDFFAIATRIITEMTVQICVSITVSVVPVIASIRKCCLIHLNWSRVWSSTGRDMAWSVPLSGIQGCLSSFPGISAGQRSCRTTGSNWRRSWSYCCLCSGLRTCYNREPAPSSSAGRKHDTIGVHHPSPSVEMHKHGLLQGKYFQIDDNSLSWVPSSHLIYTLYSRSPVTRWDRSE